MEGNQVNFGVDDEMKAVLEKIEARYGVKPPAFAKLLTKAGCQFFTDNNFFHFPVRVFPEPLGMVAEEQAPYLPSKDPTSPKELTAALRKAARAKAKSNGDARTQRPNAP